MKGKRNRFPKHAPGSACLQAAGEPGPCYLGYLLFLRIPEFYALQQNVQEIRREGSEGLPEIYCLGSANAKARPYFYSNRFSSYQHVKSPQLKDHDTITF